MTTGSHITIISGAFKGHKGTILNCLHGASGIVYYAVSLVKSELGFTMVSEKEITL